MTSTELAIPEAAAAAIPAKIQYSKALADSGLLPQSYRKQPANILFAIEYADLLGLPPMAAITGIHVIDGKPSISAGLISALVRRAGHRLRVIGDEHQAQAEITRADDPGFTYKAIWTVKRAEQAGLLSKQNWRQYRTAMLKARAISEVARDACQEVLLGMAYTADELGYEGLTDGDADDIGVMRQDQRMEHNDLRRMNEPPPGAVQKLDHTPPEDPWLMPPPDPAAPGDDAAASASAAPSTPDPAPSAPHRNQAGKPALDKLQRLQQQVLGTWPEYDVHDMFERIIGADWTATRSQVSLVASTLEDALTAAKGDAEVASSSLWKQFHKEDGNG